MDKWLIYIYIYMYVCMYVCMYVRTNVTVHIFEQDKW